GPDVLAEGLLVRARHFRLMGRSLDHAFDDVFMNSLDLLVLIGAIVGIAVVGLWRTRGYRDLSQYLKGNQTTGWMVVGISVMATQASAITFISATGQGYQDGLGFVQNYFGLPLAMIMIAAVFL